MARYLGGRSPLVIVTLGLAVVAVLAVLDFASGFELSFALFYVLPVAFVAWYAGRNPAVLVSVASAVAWEEANRLAGQTYSSATIPFWNAFTRLGFFLIISLLLVLLKQTLEREQALSRTDSLTGLKNRRAFQEEAQAELARARRSTRSLTLVYLDLDDFKFVNDRFGHDGGDRLLCAVARTLRDNVRVTDMVYRFGGDEFGVLLPETGDGGALTIVEKLHGTLLRELNHNQWPVGVSAGVLTCLATPDTVDTLTRLADQLMYGVKASGKNAIRHSVYTG